VELILSQYCEISFRKGKRSRNPSFSGTYSLTKQLELPFKRGRVAILLLVELILSLNTTEDINPLVEKCRNPSFSGTYSLTVKILPGVLGSLLSRNPSFSGTYSLTKNHGKQSVVRRAGRNPSFSGTYSLTYFRLFARVRINTRGRNPSFSGTYSLTTLML